MVVLVTGDRHYPYERKRLVYDAISRQVVEHGEDIEIVEGGATGADSYAYDAAKSLRLVCHEYPAKWSRYGNSAGRYRNKQMLDSHNVDLVLAFHDNLRDSSGTKNMIEQALDRGIAIILHRNGEAIEMEQLDLFEL